jgi:DNA-binding MarR family transcriptional regulator
MDIDDDKNDLDDNKNDLIVKKLFEAISNFKRLNSHPKAPCGITQGEMKMLFCIRHMTKSLSGGIKASEISKRLMIAPPTATQQINGLVERGYVTREINSTDRRAVRIKLTQEGEELIKVAKDKFFSLTKDIVDEIGEEDSIKLTELLNNVFDIMNKKAQQSKSNSN